ncbi:hypothetical protein Pla108_18400 [Botrimarina colliarenosi]|uniref:DUF2291 domain-containing protein n=1 Tax=Botrimarina colliarenosi TaxID=2528001 RepID=A0A5C6AEE9_9BACT|nr:DUF2291 family protein [Botrimarina colliarenosi]TWT97688.1 hypothetical protein Pla108_18400 [Botrimarina colliarenosi]
MSGHLATRLVALAVIGTALYFFPLVRLVPLGGSNPAQAEGYDAAVAATAFWTDRLGAAIAGADDAALVATAMADDPAEAGERFGIRKGVGKGFDLFIQGRGKVVDKTTAGVLLRLTPAGVVLLRTGPVFGSTIRDAVGAGAEPRPPTSRDGNDLANEINRLAEERAVVLLVDAQVGETLRFAGCAKVSSPARWRGPLELSPVLVEVP